MNGYMLDTTVFNHLVNEELGSLRISISRPIYVTHVQLNEIQCTRDPLRLQALLGMFTAIESERIPTTTAVYGISEFGEAEYSSDHRLYQSLLSMLDSKNKSKRNNVRDVLIAETAIQHKLVLVTDDCDLSDVVREIGGEVVSLKDLAR